jgi:ABC-type molybdenum transport system ATPase subunit/photorepair protein PhrA
MLAGNIPLQSVIRQGCPLSMVVFALCLHPILRMLDDNLKGIKLAWQKRSVPVIAYADNVTVFVTHHEEYMTLQQAIST